MSQIVILGGPPGAGKSTVADALCERYDRTVHLEVDDAYAWIRMGYILPWRDGSARQNMMVNRAAARAATAYAQEQFGVFIDGVIGPAHLPAYVEEMRVAGVPIHYVVLLPSVETIIRRADEREKEIANSDGMFEKVHAMFADDPGLPGWTLDNGNMSANATADAVMEACGRGDALVWSPP